MRILGSHRLDSGSLTTDAGTHLLTSHGETDGRSR